MHRNAGNDENGRFDEIFLTILINYVRFCSQVAIYRPREKMQIWQKWRKWRFWRNLVKAVDEMLQANLLTRLEGPQRCS